MTDITHLLGEEAPFLLEHQSTCIPRDSLTLPGPDYVDRTLGLSNRSTAVLRSYQSLLNQGRLGGTGYISILPVDQGVEHSAGASFAPNPRYFDPRNILELALQSGCSAVASTFGALGCLARRYAHKIPFIVKLNHNDALIYPSEPDQTFFGRVKQAHEMGAIGVGATIYFGSPASRRQVQEVSEAFEQAHQLGMITVLWTYLRNPGFKTEAGDYHTAADLTGQANYLGVTLQADIIKQKMAETNGGFNAIAVGKTHPKVYSQLTGEHPIDRVRYQIANCYMGRIGLINSGGPSTGADDLSQAVRTAVINKRAGGMGLISGRKAFQKPMKEGIALLNAIQDVYLSKAIAPA